MFMRIENGWIKRGRVDHRRGLIVGASVFAAAIMVAATPARAAAPQVTVVHQVMVGTGLAARNPFEAWLVLDKSSDPTVPGYAVPAGATVRVTFPKAFTPKSGVLSAVMLNGWAQGPIPAKFTTATDPNDPRTVVITLIEPIAAGPAEHPGLKAGTQASLPIDFLVTLPAAPRTSVSLKAVGDGSLTILGDGQPIGSIKTTGVPITLEPQAFGPGFARLGIVEVHATAGMTAGTAQIVAALDDGTHYAIHLLVEGP
jgi:hypothetical protein